MRALMRRPDVQTRRALAAFGCTLASGIAIGTTLGAMFGERALVALVSAIVALATVIALVRLASARKPKRAKRGAK